MPAIVLIRMACRSRRGVGYCGHGLGVFNGLFIHFIRLPAFIVTFCMFGIAASIPMIIPAPNLSR